MKFGNMKLGNMTNLFILFFILMVLGFLYRRFEDKLMREENKDNYEAIQKYLLDDVTLDKSKKPILWIHVPYEYNSRQWLSFGSRSSFDLNQPYLYLTVRSIINYYESKLNNEPIEISKSTDGIMENFIEEYIKQFTDENE